MTLGWIVLDADGVIQRGYGRSFAGLLPEEVIPAFEKEFDEIEERCLTGTCLESALSGWLSQEHLTPVLPILLERRLHFEPDLAAKGLIMSLRSRGYSVALATNQVPERMRLMRQAYWGLFDESLYSCDLGLSKPSVDFFAALIRILGVPAEKILFVDDRSENTRAASALGIATVNFPRNAGMSFLASCIHKWNTTG